MTKKPVYTYIFIFVSLVVLFALKEKKTETAKIPEEHFSVQTYAIQDGGWGYSIFDGKKRIIKQDFIPGIVNSISFQSEEDARHTGLLVIEKLESNKLPTIKTQELEKLQISLEDQYVN